MGTELFRIVNSLLPPPSSLLPGGRRFLEKVLLISLLMLIEYKFLIATIDEVVMNSILGLDPMFSLKKMMFEF